jgi:transposase
MAVSIQRIAPVAHLPLALEVLRKLNVAQLTDTLIPPTRPTSCPVAAGWKRWCWRFSMGTMPSTDERGMLPLLQPGLEAASVHDTRLGQILDALCAANLNRVFGAMALHALDTYAIETSWLHQDTTTIALYGAYEEAAADPAAPRPAYGHSKDSRDDLKQVLLSLGVSGDGGIPLRMGLRDGNTSDSVDVPQAIAESLALGLDGVKGVVADSKAYSQRTLGLCLEQHVGLVPLVPHTCGIRQEVEKWGQRQSSLPLLIAKPGRTRQEPPRRWDGRSVTRVVEVAYADGRVVLEPVRFVAVYSTQLAQQHAEAYEAGQRREAAALGQSVAEVEARRFACEADAEAAMAEYAGSGQGRRGRKPYRWRYHAVEYRVQTAWRRKKRTHRGRPAKGEPVDEELCYRLSAEVKALAPPMHTYGWLVLATTVDAHTSSDAEIVRAYRDQTTTVEPGFRWIKNPAAICPVWLKKPERIAALALLTVVGLLVYGLIQRQVRQDLQQHHHAIPGKKGDTAMPTAAVVLASFARVSLVHLKLDGTEARQVYGWQEHHRLVCKALGGDDAWYVGATAQKNNPTCPDPP